MKKLTLALSILFAATSAMAAGEPELKTDDQRLGYSIGYSQGRDFYQRGIDFDPAAFAQGMKDAIKGKASTMTDEEMQAAIQKLNETLVKRYQEQGDMALQEGKAFLAENKKKPGITTLPSGLQYRVIKEGTGQSPNLNDSVVAHYRGTLINGKEFDSSYKRNAPTTFPLRGVIRGWQEALPLMKEGGKLQIFVPSNLGYGTSGSGQAIPPNSVLIFDIELLKVNVSKGPGQ